MLLIVSSMEPAFDGLLGVADDFTLGSFDALEGGGTDFGVKEAINLGLTVGFRSTAN